MPLFFQKQINEYTKLAVWEIMEPEDFFLQKVTLQKEITHPHKRLQHLAGRYLLQFLEPGFPLQLLTISESRKPLIEDNSYHFSISHCGDFAAVIISRKTNVGIDVELVNPKIQKLANKFLEEKELKLIEDTIISHRIFQGSPTFLKMITPGLPTFERLETQQPHNNEIKWLTLFWSCKEAMFKWYGKGGVDFKKNMVIEDLNITAEGGTIQTKFQKEIIVSLNSGFLFFQDLCLVWVQG